MIALCMVADLAVKQIYFLLMYVSSILVADGLKGAPLNTNS